MSTESQDTNARIAALDSRVGGLEQGFSRLEGAMVSSIKGISDKLEARSTPQWGVYVSLGALLLGILGFIGTAWKAPIDAQLAAVSVDVHRMQTDYVPKWVHDRQWTSDEKERTRLYNQIEELRARLDKR